MTKRQIVILNDNETWTELDGCFLAELDLDVPEQREAYEDSSTLPDDIEKWPLEDKLEDDGYIEALAVLRIMRLGVQKMVGTDPLMLFRNVVPDEGYQKMSDNVRERLDQLEDYMKKYVPDFDKKDESP